jgi:hypothetical protein
MMTTASEESNLFVGDIIEVKYKANGEDDLTEFFYVESNWIDTMRFIPLLPLLEGEKVAGDRHLNMPTVNSKTFLESVKELNVIYRADVKNRSIVNQRGFSEGQNVRLVFTREGGVETPHSDVADIYGTIVDIDYENDGVTVQLGISAGKWDRRQIRIEFAFQGFPLSGPIANLIHETPPSIQKNCMAEEPLQETKEEEPESFAPLDDKKNAVLELTAKMYCRAELTEDLLSEIYRFHMGGEEEKGRDLCIWEQAKREMNLISQLLDQYEAWGNFAETMPSRSRGANTMMKWILPIANVSTISTDSLDDATNKLISAPPDLPIMDRNILVDNCFDVYDEKRIVSHKTAVYETMEFDCDHPLEIIIHPKAKGKKDVDITSNAVFSVEKSSPCSIKAKGILVFPPEYISFAKHFCSSTPLLDKVRLNRNFLPRWKALLEPKGDSKTMSLTKNWSGYYNAGCTDFRFPLKMEDEIPNSPERKTSALRDMVAPSTKQLLKRIHRIIHHLSKQSTKSAYSNSIKLGSHPTLVRCARNIILEGSVYGIQKALCGYNGDNYVLSEYNRPVLRTILQDFDNLVQTCNSVCKKVFSTQKPTSSPKSNKHRSKERHKNAQILSDLFSNENKMKLWGSTALDEVILKRWETSNPTRSVAAELLKLSKKVDGSQFMYHLILEKAFLSDALRSTHDVLLAYSTEDFINQERCFYRKLAKKYDSVEEMMKEHRTATQAGCPLHVDAEYDSTPYNLYNVVTSSLETPKNDKKGDSASLALPKTKELIFHRLKLLVIEKYGYEDSHADLVTGFIMNGKRPVMENEYCVIVDSTNVHPRRYFRWEWIQPNKGHWLLDPDVDDFSFIVICNVSLQCASKVDIKSLRLSLRDIFLSRMLTAFDKNQESTSKLQEDEIAKIHMDLFSKYQTRLQNRSGPGYQSFPESMLATTSHVMKDLAAKFSPFINRRDEILIKYACCGPKAACFHDQLIQFVGDCCRIHISEENESPLWLYCRLSSVPILPIVYLRAAEAFQSGANARLLKKVWLAGGIKNQIEPLLGIRLTHCHREGRVSNPFANLWKEGRQS